VRVARREENDSRGVVNGKCMKEIVVSDMIGSRPRVAESADVVNLGSRDLYYNCLSRSDIDP
jgi:hypothetical protein